MKYLIIEDEPLAAERLQAKIADLRPDWQCLAVLSSVAALRKELTQYAADLIFADINLGDGLSLPALQELHPQAPLIFTTAYDQYALEAFKLNSVDYLLKPVHPEDLLRAVKKVEQKGLDVPPWEELLRSMQKQYKERFLVSTGERLVTVKSEEIAFFYAQGKHCFLTDKAGKEYLLDFNLKDLLLKLNPAVFFQINRQFIININYIKELIPYSKSRVKLVINPPTPEEAIVSVDRSPKFKVWLEGED